MANNKTIKNTIENTIEEYLKSSCDKRGYLCYKFVSPSQNGVPDRIIIANGYTIFIELKRPNKNKLDPLQKIICQKMRNNGAIVLMINNKKSIDNLMKSIEKKHKKLNNKLKTI